jgi:hypothetical protein
VEPLARSSLISFGPVASSDLSNLTVMLYPAASHIFPPQKFSVVVVAHFINAKLPALDRLAMLLL